MGRSGSPPGGMYSAPSAVSWGPGRVDVFAMGSDYALWHRAYDGSWHAWESWGGVIVDAPIAISWGPGMLEAFSRGSDRSSLFGAYWMNGVWGWENAGIVAPDSGTATDAVWTAISPAPGLVDVFGVDSVRTPANLHARHWSGAGWSAIANLPSVAYVRGIGAAVTGSGGLSDVLLDNNQFNVIQFQGGQLNFSPINSWAGAGSSTQSVPVGCRVGSNAIFFNLNALDGLVHAGWAAN